MSGSQDDPQYYTKAQQEASEPTAREEALLEQIETYQEALEKVLRIHSKVCRDGIHVDCSACLTGVEWPCPTVLTLTPVLPKVPALAKADELVEWFNTQPRGWLSGIDEDRAYSLVCLLEQYELLRRGNKNGNR